MKTLKLLFSLAVISTLVSVTAFAQETKVARKNVPSVVLETFAKTYPKASIKQTNKEIKDGVTYFEIESKDGKTKRDVLFSQDGSISEVEEMIGVKALPHAVEESVENKYPGEKVVTIEKNVKGNTTHYEILLSPKKGKKHEVIFDESGAVVPS